MNNKTKYKINHGNNQIKAQNLQLHKVGRKQYQSKSKEKTNNKTEKMRKYVHGVAEGDAFSRSSRSLANDWNNCGQGKER